MKKKMYKMSFDDFEATQDAVKHLNAVADILCSPTTLHGMALDWEPINHGLGVITGTAVDNIEKVLEPGKEIFYHGDAQSEASGKEA